MYVVFLVHQGINFQTLVYIFLCMKLQIHNHITIVKCCFGPLLPHKKLHRSNSKYVFQNATSQNLIVLSLILKHLISQRHFTFFKFQNTRFMVEHLVIGVFFNDNQYKTKLTGLLEFSKLMFNHWPTISDGLFCPSC
jgi:hypothetical protein